ncbi:MAG: DUF3108 domain-containing protein [Sulfurimicrobium sp.]|nr:DUF3108 domain-containing protein [Sulfurimicrobium sp.]
MAAPRTTVKRFAWALALSLLAHLIITFGPAISVPDYHPDPVLEASIRSESPTPLPAPHRVTKARKPPPRKHAPQPPAPLPATPPTAEPEPAAPPAQEESAAPTVPEPAGTETLTENAIQLPELAEISYTLYNGSDGFAVGKVQHTWKRDGTRYSINQVAEASGIVSLFYTGRHVQISQGELAAEGLKPTSYWVQRGQRADKTDTAQFDWENMRLTLGTGGDTRTVKLPDGTQDLLSFLYQLAFSPPQQGDSTRLHITTGRKLDNYGYQSLGEETLETRLGPIKALHIGQVRQQGEENTEIWLATEYHYLPVKIRYTDKQGGVMEQTATAIKVQ